MAEIAATHPAITRGEAEIFVMPSYLSVPSAVQILDGVAAVGAQDLAAQENGPYTGEVSGAQISEFGCTFVEVGHSERRRLFGETDEIVRRKTDAALRNGLSPVLCLGEIEKQDPGSAAAECVRQLKDALSAAGQASHGGRVIVAYEPQWAIGAPEPASAEHIRAVCRHLREQVHGLTNFPGSAVIYGGSAMPGLLTSIAGDVDGIFLGRFAHDPAAVGLILDEVRKLCASDKGEPSLNSGGRHA